MMVQLELANVGLIGKIENLDFLICLIRQSGALFRLIKSWNSELKCGATTAPDQSYLEEMLFEITVDSEDQKDFNVTWFVY